MVSPWAVELCTNIMVVHAMGIWSLSSHIDSSRAVSVNTRENPQTKQNKYSINQKAGLNQIHAWNIAPVSIKQAKTSPTLKKEIKLYVKTLPA